MTELEDNSASFIELVVSRGLQLKPISSRIYIDTITEGIEELIARCGKNRRERISPRSQTNPIAQQSHKFHTRLATLCALRQFAVENISLLKVGKSEIALVILVKSMHNRNSVNILAGVCAIWNIYLSPVIALRGARSP